MGETAERNDSPTWPNSLHFMPSVSGTMQTGSYTSLYRLPEPSYQQSVAPHGENIIRMPLAHHTPNLCLNECFMALFLS